jgi:Tfp pilus assembly protein PilE
MELDRKKRSKEASFTLLETMIAVFIMSMTVLEIAGIKGNSIYFYEYGSNSIQASWLAQRVMSNVEYHWNNKDFKDLAVDIKEAPFEDYPNFKYSLTIREWKLPIVDMLAQGGLNANNTNNDSNTGNEISGMIKTAMSQIFDDQILKVARVEVSWPEGARRNDVSLTYLLTNQRRLDEFLETMKGAHSQLEQSTRGAAPRPEQGRQ